METKIISTRVNEVIKELYNKFYNTKLTSLLTCEEILKRDFDNLFVFEDYFGDILSKHCTKEFKDKMVEDLVDLIKANMGDITIDELVEAINNPIVRKTKKEEENDIDILIPDIDNIENIESDLDVSVAGKVLCDLNNFNTEETQKKIKEINSFSPKSVIIIKKNVSTKK